MDRYPEEQFVNSLIGFGSRFKGDIEIDGLFRVDGDFSGSIKTDGKVLIGNRGRADCTVNARVVVIGGVFRGTIYASEKILILASALVIGNLYTPRLVAEEGVLIQASLVITGKKEKNRATVQNRSRSAVSTSGPGAPSPNRGVAGRNPRSRGLFGRAERKRAPSNSQGSENDTASGHGQN